MLAIRITARLPSVTLKACTKPRNASAAASALLGSAPKGGVISAVITGPGPARACSKLMAIAALLCPLYLRYPPRLLTLLKHHWGANYGRPSLRKGAGNH